MRNESVVQVPMLIPAPTPDLAADRDLRDLVIQVAKACAEEIGDGRSPLEAPTFRMLCRFAGTLDGNDLQALRELWVQAWERPAGERLYAELLLITGRRGAG